jgi:hypothetical protein
MTAVEWLEKELQLYYEGESKLVYYEIIEQAKEMEKEQIIEACNQTDFEDINGMGIHETITKGEEYYNETFKSK